MNAYLRLLYHVRGVWFLIAGDSSVSFFIHDNIMETTSCNPVHRDNYTKTREDRDGPVHADYSHSQEPPAREWRVSQMLGTSVLTEIVGCYRHV